MHPTSNDRSKLAPHTTRAAAGILAALVLTATATTTATPALGVTLAQDESQPAEQQLSPDRQKAAKHEASDRIRDAKFSVDGKKNLALGGYDPVAYFPDHGGKATKGKKKITHVHKGVTYRFANESNLATFKANPEQYEPAYGGWCAYAMAKGDYTEANPKRFTIQGGRLMVFYDGLFGDTYDSWFEEGPTQLEPDADRFWANELEAEANK
ncbi:MAG: YHS domain-containing (seleno)protein [Planctomycetota bacterium]